MSCHDRPPVTPTRQAISTTARDVERAYAARGFDVEVADEVVGPRTVALTLVPRRGATVRATCSLVVDVQVALGTPSASARVVDGRLILELGRRDPEFPTLRSVLGRPRARGKFAIGIDVCGDVVDVVLGDCPHAAVSGQSGSGKTEALHTIIGGLVATHDTDDLGLALIDLKGTELTRWAWLPHLVEDVIVDADAAHDLFCRVLDTVEGRYRQNDGAPPLVVVVDEFADLVAQADVLPVVTRIAQKARAANVHLIVATQRPSVKVLPGDLKANLPVRLALRTATQVDSRVVIDRAGAEKLLGKGDALLMDAGGIRRLQVPMVAPDEFEWLRQHYTTKEAPT